MSDSTPPARATGTPSPAGEVLEQSGLSAIRLCAYNERQQLIERPALLSGDHAKRAPDESLP
jgi:hypothetical protein